MRQKAIYGLLTLIAIMFFPVWIIAKPAIAQTASNCVGILLGYGTTTADLNGDEVVNIYDCVIQISTSTPVPTVAGSGTLNVYSADILTDSSSDLLYEMWHQGNRYDVEITDNVPQLKSNFTIDFKGILENDKLIIKGDRLDVPAELSVLVSDDNDFVKVSRELLVVPINFNNYSDQPVGIGQLENLFFRANLFFQENSYNQTGFVVNILDWQSLDRNSPTQAECKNLKFKNEIFNQVFNLIDGLVDLNKYNQNGIIFLLFPSDVCSGGLSSIGREYSVQNGVANLSSKVFLPVNSNFTSSDDTALSQIIYQLGHSYGAYHANLYNCVPGEACESWEYLNKFDGMGGWNGQGIWHFNAATKAEIGWLTESENCGRSDLINCVLTVNNPGVYTINPLTNQDSSYPSPIRGIKIPSMDFKYDSLYIDYPKPPEFSANNNYTEGPRLLYTTNNIVWNNSNSHSLDTSQGSQGGDDPKSPLQFVSDFDDSALGVGRMFHFWGGSLTGIEYDVYVMTCEITDLAVIVAIDQACPNLSNADFINFPISLSNMQIPQKEIQPKPVVIFFFPHWGAVSSILESPDYIEITSEMITILENNGYRGPDWNDGNIPIYEMFRVYSGGLTNLQHIPGFHNKPGQHWVKLLDLNLEFSQTMPPVLEAISRDSQDYNIIGIGHSAGGAYATALAIQPSVYLNPNVYILGFSAPFTYDSRISNALSLNPRFFYWEYNQDPIAYKQDLLTPWWFYMRGGGGDTLTSHLISWFDKTRKLSDGTEMFMDYSGIRNGITNFLNRHFPPVN